MNFSIPGVFRVLIFFTLVFLSSHAFAQQIAEEVFSKLSDTDQKKITKAENLDMKADLDLSKSGCPSDNQLLDMLSSGETKELKKWSAARISYSNANKELYTIKYQVFNKNCTDFWKKYTGEQNPLLQVKGAEQKAVDLFNEAENIRKAAGKNANLSEKLSLLIEAENKENESIQLLQKVLFVYQNYPASYDQSWFSPVEDKKPAVKEISPKDSVKTQEIPKESKKIIPETSKNISTPDTTHINKPKKELTKSGDSSIYMIANVNEDQIDMFNAFLQKKYPNTYENYIIDFQNIDYSNLQNLKDAWYRYRFGSSTTDSIENMVATESGQKTDSLSKDSTIEHLIAQDIKSDNEKNVKTSAGKSKEQKSIIKAGSKTKTDTSQKEVVVADNNIKATDNNSNTINSTDKKSISKENNLDKNISGKNKTESTENFSEPIAKGFLFRVQIAASRIQLSDSIIRKIYSGPEKVIETYEDNWYKYTIGEFNTYRQARTLRDNTVVNGDFVVAYLNGKRIKITPAVVIKKQIEQVNSENTNIQADKIEFRIQIKASKNQLTDKELKKLYQGSISIETVEEEGWYKYSILAGNKLSDAIELLKSVNSPDAFIVAYYLNQKINLHTAIKLTKQN